jgi:hypothetical protein
VVYGLDVKTAERLSQADWIDSYINRSTVSYPVLFMLYRNGNVQLVTSFTSQAEIDALVASWSRGSFSTPSPTPTPTPAVSGSPTPTPTPTGIALTDRRFYETTEWNATNEYKNYGTFVYLYIDSSKPYDAAFLSGIQEAVAKAGYRVYYADHRYEPQDATWFIDDYFLSSSPSNPTLFFIHNKGFTDVLEKFDAYTVSTADQLASKISSFFSEYGGSPNYGF